MFDVLKAVRNYSEPKVFSSHQWDYDFAVRVGLEVIGVLQLLAQDPMIVNLTIDSKR